jgi:hypothetical protein
MSDEASRGAKNRIMFVIGTRSFALGRIEKRRRELATIATDALTDICGSPRTWYIPRTYIWQRSSKLE